MTSYTYYRRVGVPHRRLAPLFKFSYRASPPPRSRSAAAHVKTRAEILDDLKQANSVQVRSHVGKYALIDPHTQPQDDIPQLVATPVDEASAHEILAREYHQHIEGSIGVEYETIRLLRDTLDALRRVVAGDHPGGRAALTREVAALERRAERETAVTVIVEALVHRLLPTDEDLGRDDENVIRAREWRLTHLVHDRADELARWLDSSARRWAETQALQAHPTLTPKQREAKYPGQLDQSHHARFRTMLKTWTGTYIPRADFINLTHFSQIGHHWTDQALKAHAAALAKAAAQTPADDPTGEDSS